MNPIASRIEKFIAEYDELEKLNTQSTKDLSNIDLELSSLYHRVEGSKITHVSQSHKLIKELQDILERRRNIKLEGVLLRSTCDLLKDKIGAVKGHYRKTLTKDTELRTEIKTRANE